MLQVQYRILDEFDDVNDPQQPDTVKDCPAKTSNDAPYSAKGALCTEILKDKLLGCPEKGEGYLNHNSEQGCIKWDLARRET